MNQLFYATMEVMAKDSMQENAKDSLLIKRLAKVYFERPVRDTVQALLDPQADEYNKAYDAAQRKVAILGTEMLADAAANPQVVVDVVGLLNENNGGEKKLNLNTTLSDYSAVLLKQRKEHDESGNILKYDLIELAMSANSPGGLELRISSLGTGTYARPCQVCGYD